MRVRCALAQSADVGRADNPCQANADRPPPVNLIDAFDHALNLASHTRDVSPGWREA
jgi:hypothetical protein